MLMKQDPNFIIYFSFAETGLCLLSINIPTLDADIVVSIGLFPCINCF